MSELVRDQIIVKEENGQYSLASDQKFLMYENHNLDEERVFTADIFPFLESLPTNVIEAWRYRTVRHFPLFFGIVGGVHLCGCCSGSFLFLLGGPAIFYIVALFNTIFT